MARIRLCEELVAAVARPGQPPATELCGRKTRHPGARCNLHRAKGELPARSPQYAPHLAPPAEVRHARVS